MAYNNITPIRLGQLNMLTSYLIMYTSPSNARVFVKDINIMNTTATTKYVYVNLVPDGDSPTSENALFYYVALPPYTLVQWAGSQILHPGDTIQVKASAEGCTITASGGEAV
jgi:hypothetical protein